MGKRLSKIATRTGDDGSTGLGDGSRSPKDALRIVAEGVNALRAKDRSFLVITHYQRLLEHIVPDTVHVMAKGRIVKTGGKELALELEANGYRDYAEAAA